MGDINLRVDPAADGWGVACDLPMEPTYFRSGARAEQVARTLAIHLSGAGHDVTVIIRDRSRQDISTQRYFAL